MYKRGFILFIFITLLLLCISIMDYAGMTNMCQHPFPNDSNIKLYNKVNIYEYSNNNLIKPLFDSVLSKTMAPWLSLSYDRRKDGHYFLQLRYRTYNIDEFNKIDGIIYSNDSLKNILITNVPMDILNEWGIIKNQHQTVLNYDMFEKNKIDPYPLGYVVQLLPNVDSNYSIGLGYNGINLHEIPQLKKEFSWLYSQNGDSIVCSQSQSKIYETYLKMHTDKQQRPKGIYLNDTHDTIFSASSYWFITEPKKDSTFSLPLYEFNSKYDRCFIGRICDSIAKYNIFNQLWIKQLEHTNDKNQFYIGYSELYDEIGASIDGVILNSTREIPIFISGINFDELKQLGIRQTNIRVTIKLLGDKQYFPPDSRGFEVWIDKFQNGKISVHLEYDGHKLGYQLSQPFMWLLNYH